MDEVELAEPLESPVDLIAAAQAAAEQASAPDLGDPEGGEQSPFEAAAEAGGDAAEAESPPSKEGTEAPQSETPEASPFAELRRLAREKQQELTPQPEPPPAQAQPEVGKLLETIAAQNRERAAIEELKRTGSLKSLAELTGEDPGVLFERMAKHGMQPGSVSAEQELADLRARLAQVEEGYTKGLEEYKQEQAEKAEQERAARDGQELLRLAKDSESFPFMGTLAPDEQMEYANAAWSLLYKQHGRVPTPKETAELAEKQLRHLAHKIRGVSENTSADRQSDAIASESANRGSNQRRGTIDNRTASEVSAIPPDPLDEESRVQRAIRAAEAAGRQA